MSHYFDVDPTVASDQRQVPLVLPDVSLDLTTDRGVFARHGVDPGTKFLLLDAPPPPATGNVADLGCGYGPIALAQARRAPQTTVWALDVNQRALALTASNAKAAGLDNVRTASPDQVPDHVRFAAIWSNPPVRIGKAALQDLLRCWLDRLEVDGCAWLVVHKHLGADSLARWLNEAGYATQRRCSRMGYRLLEVAARPHAGRDAP